MNHLFNATQLLLLVFLASACSDGSSSGTGNESGSEEDEIPGAVDDGINTENPMNPVAVTADTETFLGLPYRQARSELIVIAAGNIQLGDAAFRNYFAFALSPERVDELIVDEVADCPGGGTIEYLYAADGSGDANGGVLFTERTYHYTNCISAAGFVNGSIVIRLDETVSGTDSDGKTSGLSTLNFPSLMRKAH